MSHTSDLPLYALPLEEKETKLEIKEIARVAAGVGILAVGVAAGALYGNEVLSGDHSFQNVGMLVGQINNTVIGWRLAHGKPLFRNDSELESPNQPE